MRSTVGRLPGGQRLRRRWLESRTVAELTPPPPPEFAHFGPRSQIVPPARVRSPGYISIGSDTVIHEHAWLSVVPEAGAGAPVLRIGDRCSIGRMCHIACVGSVDIGDDVLSSDRVFIGDTYHRYQDPTVAVIRQPLAPSRPVVIDDGAFLGIGAVVLPGVRIGAGAYVAAGAVVTSDVAPRTLVLGNPARAARRYDPDRREWREAEHP